LIAVPGTYPAGGLDAFYLEQGVSQGGTVPNQQAAVSAIGKTGFLAITDSADKALASGATVKLVCPLTSPKCAPKTATGTTNVNASVPVLQVVVPGSQIKQGSASVGYAQDGTPTVNYSMTGGGSGHR